MRAKTLWVREEQLRQILEGRKTIEVRVGYSNITRLQVGDHLRFNESYWYRIRRIGRYADFGELLRLENHAAIAPDTPADQLLNKIRAIYAPEKESLGVIALEIEPR